MDDESLDYQALAAELLAACGRRDREVMGVTFDRIKRIGWNRGVAALIGAALMNLLDSIHEGGLWTPIDGRWIRGWQEQMVQRHGGWTTVEDDAVRRLILAAQGDHEAADSFEGGGLPVARALLIETIAHVGSGGDQSKYEELLAFSLEMGIRELREMQKHIELPFKV